MLSDHLAIRITCSRFHVVVNQLPRRYRISDDKKLLTIENLCRDCTDRPESRQSDLGVIQCNASNRHGHAFAAGYVNVLCKHTLRLTLYKCSMTVKCMLITSELFCLEFDLDDDLVALEG